VVDYCGVADVKPVLHIDLAETSEDVELADCVTDASGKVDDLLKASGFVVPSVVPITITKATKFFAAWEYRRRRDPLGAQVFWYDAQEAIQEYIAAQKVDEGEPYVGSV
jgi:hypothetical protein